MPGWSEYAKFFAGLISIVNPIGSVPLFLSLTAGQTRDDRKRTGLFTSISVMAVLMTVLAAGETILNLFGITVPSFRVGGGILILLMAISMMHARLSPAKQTEEEAQDAAEKNSVAVVPLGIPLLAGPGAISTVIVYAHSSSSPTHYIILGSEIIGVSFIVWICLRLSPLIASRVGKTGMNIVSRIMGLITAAISIEFITGGLKQIFPALS
jgi:multiple antibiotic resistance protein